MSHKFYQTKYYVCVRDQNGARVAKARYRAIRKVKKNRIDHKMVLIARAKNGATDITKLSIDAQESCADVFNTDFVVKNYFDSTKMKKGVADPFVPGQVSFKDKTTENNGVQKVTINTVKPRGNGYIPKENLGKIMLVQTDSKIVGCGIITEDNVKCPRKEKVQ